MKGVVVKRCGRIALPWLVSVVLTPAGPAWGQQCIPAHPSGLVSWWPGDGNANDFVGSNHGVAVNGASYAVGRVGQAFSFDGVDDYVQVGERPSLLITDTLSIVGWIFPTGPGSASFWGGAIVNQEGRYEVHRMADGRITVAIANTTPGWNSVITPFVAPLNQWTHLAVVYDGSAMKTYGNGSLAHTIAASGPIVNALGPPAYPAWNDFRIGGRQCTHCIEHFQGLIDELEVHDRALPAEEIQAVFDAGSAGRCKHPSADAGPDQTVDEGAPVQLAGSATDPRGETLTYAWTQVGGPAAGLSDDSILDPTFAAPSVPAGGAVLTFQLVATSGLGSSDPDTVNITVKNVNHRPVAETAGGLTVPEQSLVTLDGSASFDVDGEPLAFIWTQTLGTSVALSDPSSEQPTFTAPAVGPEGGTLAFQLVVNDGIEDSDPAVVSVAVTNVNQAPTADAGADISVNENSTVVLSGAGSDPEGDALTFNWTQTGGSPVVLSDPTSRQPSFVAPSVAPEGEDLAFQLVVSDAQLDSIPDQVTVHVSSLNDPPNCALAAASPALLWPPNHKLVPVSIAGVVDPQGDAISITVTGVTQDEPTNGLGDGDTTPDAVIQGGTVLLRSERHGSGNGRVYVVAFKATDAQGASCSGSVRVSVPKSMKDGGAVDDGQVHQSVQP